MPVDDQRLGVGLEVLAAPGSCPTSRSQVSKCSSLSVAPAGLGYIATTQSVTLECMKNARPIGIRNCAQSSSGSSKPSSHSVRLPVGPELGVARAQRPAALAHAHDLPLVRG